MLIIYFYCFPLSIKLKSLNEKHLPNIPVFKPFVRERNDGPLYFSDISIFREKGKFVTNVKRKRSFSGVYTSFNSFIPETYKTGLIKSLLFRCFNLSFDFVKFHHEIFTLKSFLYKKIVTHVTLLTNV